MTTAADRDWNRVFPRELHTTSHVVNVRDAHHRERMTIIGKVPHLPRLVITRRIPTQHPPTNHAGKIIQVGNRIVGREGGQSPHRTRGRKPAIYEFTTGPGATIGFAHAHDLCQECYQHIPRGAIQNVLGGLSPIWKLLHGQEELSASDLSPIRVSSPSTSGRVLSLFHRHLRSWPQVTFPSDADRLRTKAADHVALR